VVVPTPHIHDEKHRDGKIAIPLETVNDKEFLNELYDSMVFF
jgi:hypothetical protein